MCYGKENLGYEMYDNRTLEIIELTKESIFDVLIEEQETNPLFFTGELECITVTLVNNNVKLNFYPGIVTPALDPQFIGKLGYLFYELKRHMIDPDAGAWLGATIFFNLGLAPYFFMFNYEDHEEGLNSYSYEDFQEEFILFPRKKEFYPEWVEEKQGKELPPPA